MNACGIVIVVTVVQDSAGSSMTRVQSIVRVIQNALTVALNPMLAIHVVAGFARVMSQKYVRQKTIRSEIHVLQFTKTIVLNWDVAGPSIMVTMTPHGATIPSLVFHPNNSPNFYINLQNFFILN